MTIFQDKTPVDFVIVGAGGAGGVVAKELSSAGFQVVVLEQGPRFGEQDFEHDELKFKNIFNPPFIGREFLTNDHSLQPNTFRKTEGEKAELSNFVQYGRCVGGGTVHFSANYWRFHESDFCERSCWGAVAGAELANYIRRSRTLLHQSGMGAGSFRTSRSKSLRPTSLQTLSVAANAC